MPSFDLYRSRCKSTKINLSRAAYLNFFFAVDIKDADCKFLVRVFEYREHHRFDTAFRMIEKKNLMVFTAVSADKRLGNGIRPWKHSRKSIFYSLFSLGVRRMERMYALHSIGFTSPMLRTMRSLPEADAARLSFCSGSSHGWVEREYLP